MMSGPAAKTLAALAVVCLSLGAAAAQQASVCTSSVRGNPPRELIRCPGGLLIEAEAAADITVRAPSADAVPTSVALTGHAVLIDLTPPRSFQILTPHAIASVRGTIYAVDVEAGTTAVFVARGQVRVSARQGPGAVTLGPGEGVDVRPGEPLVVRRWPQERVERLLARFGR
ncbi:MAG TPA: FecR domain-containing protein [Aurantimonas sp.]|jgi:ferric-dicitrate binding protein FerR (iron transport regulator)|nr:FecR domain-containing protein [Aurantimonas sp.]